MTGSEFIGEDVTPLSKLEELFEDAVNTNAYRKEVESRLNALDEVLMEQFDISFGNRIVTQTMNFVAVFVAAGGELVDAIDYQISTKILRKVITSDAEEALLELEGVTTDYTLKNMTNACTDNTGRHCKLHE